MNKILNQFRRIYSDDGRGDKDFTKQETLLREAQDRMINATNELMRASERLNVAALSVGLPHKHH
jgi:hypothetical protein